LLGGLWGGGGNGVLRGAGVAGRVGPGSVRGSDAFFAGGGARWGGGGSVGGGGGVRSRRARGVHGLFRAGPRPAALGWGVGLAILWCVGGGRRGGRVRFRGDGVGGPRRSCWRLLIVVCTSRRQGGVRPRGVLVGGRWALVATGRVGVGVGGPAGLRGAGAWGCLLAGGGPCRGGVREAVVAWVLRHCGGLPRVRVVWGGGLRGRVLLCDWWGNCRGGGLSLGEAGGGPEGWGGWGVVPYGKWGAPLVR